MQLILCIYRGTSVSLFRNFYRCYCSNNEWIDVWSAICDDDCPNAALDTSLNITRKMLRFGRTTCVRVVPNSVIQTASAALNSYIL